MHTGEATRGFWQDYTWRRRTRPWIIVTLAALAVSHGVWFGVLHFGHSAHIDLIRQIEVHEAFQDGYVFPRWIRDFYLGRGSPIFNFYAPFVYLLGEVLCLVGFSPLLAVKGVYIACVVFAAWGMFALGREVWQNETAGIVSSILYVLAPYLLVDLYVRSALAELSCFAWLAFALYFLLKTTRTRDTLDALRGACMVALLCLSHNITSMIGLPIILGFVLVVARGAELRKTLGAVALGLALSAFFWLPALLEKGYLNAEANLTAGEYNYTQHFVTVARLFDTRWGFGSTMNKTPGAEIMSTQIGLVHGVLFVVACAWLWRRRKDGGRPYRSALALAIAVAVGLLFTNRASQVFWDHLPLLPFVQFPFRFLTIVALGTSALAGGVVARLKETSGAKAGTLGALVIVGAAAVAYGPYVQARYLLHLAEPPYDVRVATREEAKAWRERPEFVEAQALLTPRVLREGRESKTTAKDDYLPHWVKVKPIRYFENRMDVLDGQATVVAVESPQPNFRFAVEATQPSTFLVHTFYFPGWQVHAGAERVSAVPNAVTGEIQFSLPAGHHEVDVRFQDTGARLAAKMISLGACVLMIMTVGLFQYRRVRRVGVSSNGRHGPRKSVDDKPRGIV
ncbi:hypothetical protein KDL45_09330 [bacterium]|nr:hypothetical protein [bacterium]